MKSNLISPRVFLFLLLAGLVSAGLTNSRAAQADGRYLYAASPGIRDYLEYGGHGVLVYDIDHGHKLVKRIPSSGVDDNGKPLNVKGICASAATGRIYVSNTKSLICFDLNTDKILWEKAFEGGFDRMAITPDGKTILSPGFEKDFWFVINATTGELITKIPFNAGSHNTIIGPNGKEGYMAGLKSPLLAVADLTTNQVARTVGPFSNVIRPFTINGKQTLVYVNVNGLLGFEIGDLKTGKVLHRVEVPGVEVGPTKRHGCPSHGVALTIDEKELWLADAHNSKMHIFDNTVMPPKYKESVSMRDQPGWITFSIDGSLAYPSTGEVVDIKTRKIVATLKDEKGNEVHSEKVVEVDFAGGKPVKSGDQFAIGGLR